MSKGGCLRREIFDFGCLGRPFWFIDDQRLAFGSKLLFGCFSRLLPFLFFQPGRIGAPLIRCIEIGNVNDELAHLLCVDLLIIAQFGEFDKPVLQIDTFGGILLGEWRLGWRFVPRKDHDLRKNERFDLFHLALVLGFSYESVKSPH